MEKLKYIFVLMMLSGPAVIALPTNQINIENFVIYPASQERAEVKPDDLPEKVKSSVGHKTELAWTILKAYLVTNPDQTQYYELYVQKPDGETWMKVDKEGKVLN